MVGERLVAATLACFWFRSRGRCRRCRNWARGGGVASLGRLVLRSLPQIGCRKSRNASPSWGGQDFQIHHLAFAPSDCSEQSRQAIAGSIRATLEELGQLATMPPPPGCTLGCMGGGESRPGGGQHAAAWSGAYTDQSLSCTGQYYIYLFRIWLVFLNS